MAPGRQLSGVHHVTVPAAAAAMATVLVCSPLLASWTAALSAGVQSRWWTVRSVTTAQWALTVTAVCVACLATLRGTPVVTWWLYSACGAVLAVVDARTHTLPARLVGPWAVALGASLVVAAVADDAPHRLIRSVAAAGAVGGAWLLVALFAPSMVGLGDIFVTTAGALVLGWTGWAAVGTGQVLIWVVAPVALAIEWLVHPARRSRAMPVPMGPALVTATVLALWV